MILDDYAAAVDAAFSPAKGACCLCGEDRAVAMLNRGQLCYACDCRRRGRPETEAHHLFGRPTPITIDLPVNDHRVLDAMRLGRPRWLREPGNDLLVNIAQLVLLAGEVALVIADVARREAWPEWIAVLTEMLAAKAPDAAEALLLFGGQIVECPAAHSHKASSIWRP